MLHFTIRSKVVLFELSGQIFFQLCLIGIASRNILQILNGFFHHFHKHTCLYCGRNFDISYSSHQLFHYPRKIISTERLFWVNNVNNAVFARQQLASVEKEKQRWEKEKSQLKASIEENKERMLKLESYWIEAQTLCHTVNEHLKEAQAQYQALEKKYNKAKKLIKDFQQKWENTEETVSRFKTSCLRHLFASSENFI